jgi:hypothetical protein
MERSDIRDRECGLHRSPRISLRSMRATRCRSVKRKSAPVSALGQGGALIPLPSPSQTRGMARRQGAVPGLLRAIVRITPDVGCTCVHPRLAARQRGILAFMPLTVVGPGRLLVADEAARVRPGDEVASPIARRCRSRSPPSRRLMNAPLVEWTGMAET